MLLTPRRTTVWIAIALLATAATALCIRAAAPSFRSTLSVRFTRQRYEVGKVRSGQYVTCDFDFRNTGRSPLRIRDTVTSCGCLVINGENKTVAPGQSDTIRLRLSTHGINPLQELVKTATIAFVSVGQPSRELSVDLEVHAAVRADVIPSPTTVRLLASDDAPSSAQRLTIDREMLPAEEFSRLHVMAPPYVELRETQRSADRLTYEVQLVPNRAPALPSPLLVVYGNAPAAERLPIPIQIQRPESDVRVEPKLFLALPSRLANGPDLRQGTLRRFRVSSEKYQPVTVEDIQIDRAIVAWERVPAPRTGTDEFALWLKALPENKIWSSTAYVVCSLPAKKPVRLPIDVRILVKPERPTAQTLPSRAPEALPK